MTNIKKITTASCWLVVGLMLSSCESLGPKPVAKLPLTPVKKAQPDEVIEQLENKAPATSTMHGKSELFPGTNRFVPETTTQHRKTKGTGEGAYSLNFDDADLGEVAKVILSDILGQNYVLSPKVAGKVTLQTADPLSKDELIPTLEMLLRMNNAVLIKDARIYHIEPATEALYSSNFAGPGTAAGREGYQVRVIPIRNVAVQDIVDVIKPLVQEKTILNVESARNILIASGTPDELGRVMDMVSTFDIDMLRGQSFGLFPLTHVAPETIITELEGIFYNKGKAKGKDEENEFFRFIPVERLNAVMAITHQASYLKDIENWIFRLDRANTASGGGVNVYKVQNVDAEELASTLNEIFIGGAKKEKTAKVAPGQNAAEMTNKPPTETPKSSASKSNAPTGSAEVANVGEVRIISDVANNSVVIVATPQEYEVILPVIKQLDVLPLQVLIDATIVSVTLKDELKYGISWYLSQGNSAIGSTNNPPSIGASTLPSAFGTAAAAAAAASTGGLSAIYSSGAVKALLNTQATANNINVISSPSLMVLNNQQAKINIGDQVPIQTSTSSLPVAGGTTPSIALGSSIQYKDTGVTLDVTPRVNASGMVIMEIKQIVSTPVVTSTGVSTSPTIQKKEIESSVAVHDGETIVLGGLIDETNSNNKNGIPWLQDIPWIGPVFGGTDKAKNKTELVVLITPRVVKSKQDSRLISDEFKRKLTGIYEDKAVVSGGSAVE